MDTRVDQWAANAGRVLTVAATLAVLVAAGLLVSPARLQASDECPSATAADGTAVPLAITGIFNNVKVSDTTTTGNKLFYVIVPAGVDHLDVLVHPTLPSGISPFGTAWLFVNLPTTATWPTGSGVGDMCAMRDDGDNKVTFSSTSRPPADSAGGEYYILVQKYEAGAQFDITATFQTLTAGTIAVEGGSNLIPNGDTTPSTGDGTEFGAVVMGASSSTNKTFTITNTGTESLYLTAPIAISGAGDFTVTAQPSSEIAGVSSTNKNTTSFTIQFKPTAAGARTATVTIESSDLANTPYVFTLGGSGTPGSAHPIPTDAREGCALGGGTTPAAAWGWYLPFVLVLAGAGLSGRWACRRRA
jgi:hypothetical protein